MKIEPIRSRRPRFKQSVEDLQRTARDKVRELGGQGKYTLPSGDDLEVKGKGDGTVDLDVKRDHQETAQLQYQARGNADARVTRLEEPQYLDLDRGELIDTRL